MNIETLAQQKDFDHLSPVERAEVLAEMSADEYEQLHLTLSTLRDMDADARPTPLLRERLLGRLAEQHHPPRPRWHRRPVPLWQAAAAALLVGGAVAFFFPKKDLGPDGGRWTMDGGRQTADGGRQRAAVLRDTIWLTKIVYRERTVYRERRPENALENPPPQAFMESHPLPVLTDSIPAAPFALPAAPAGTPVSAWPELMQFLGGEGKR